MRNGYADACHSLHPPSLSILGCPKQARISSGQVKHCIFQESSGCPAPCRDFLHLLLQTRSATSGHCPTAASPQTWTESRPGNSGVCSQPWEQSSPQEVKQGSGGDSRVASSTRVSIHGSRDNEKVFKPKGCSFLRQRQFEKQLFLDVLVSSAHPACGAGRLCFYPDFLPSAHSSALPSVPLEANASVGFCPYRLYRSPSMGSLPFTKTVIF